MIAYASLAHGFLSGKALSSEPDRLEASLDEGGRRGYFYPENIERLRRAEHMAAKKGCSVAQVALAYVLTDELGILPAISATKQRHLEANIAALGHRLDGRGNAPGSTCGHSAAKRRGAAAGGSRAFSAARRAPFRRGRRIFVRRANFS